MASLIPNSQSFNSVLPYAQDHRSFLARVAILSRTKLKLPKIIETAFLILEYLQLISLDIFLNESIQPRPSSPPSALYNTISALAKIVAPGYILELEGKAASVFITISAILSIVCLVKYALLLYTLIAAAMRSEGKSFFIKAWGLVLSTQSRIGYFIVTAFWTKMLSSIFQNEGLLEESQRFYLTVWSIVMIILEFALALAIEIVLPCYLPHKSFLASKSNILETITICQKLFIQIITISQLPQTLAVAWVFNSINAIINTAKSFIFIAILPFYKVKALFYQMMLLVIVSSMSLAHLAFTLMRSVLSENIEINQNFTVIIWVLIAALWTATSITGVKRLLFNLITRWEDLPAGLLVHKVVILREILRSTHEPIKFASNHTWYYLLAKSAVANLSTVLNLPSEAVADIKLETITKEQLNGLISQYLDNICRLKPKSNFLKLYQAFHYGKRLNLYGLSTSILLGLRKSSPSIGTEVSISLLMNKMSEILIAGYRIKNEKIDLYTFIQSQRIVTELKESIMQQAELQTKLCHEMNTNKANLLKVYTYSQKIVDWRTKIEQQSKSVLANIPDYHIEPLALCAHYHLVLNHSVEKYLRFYKEYTLKYQKYKSFFQSDLTCHENAYQRGNIFFVLAGRKEIVSQIMYASKEGWEYFGRDITGERAHKALNPSLQGFYQAALQATLERGDMLIMGAPIRCFHYSKQGFVTLDDFHMNISPILSRDLYYFGVVRRIPTSKEYLLINEDGTVESGTKKICMELGLLPSHPSATRTLYNITQISDDLNQAHLAFNMIAFPEKYKNEKISELDESDQIEMEYPEERKKSYTLSSKGFKTKLESRLDLNSMDMEQANKIYSSYTTEGKNLRINRIKKTLGPPLLYNCKMENQVYGNVLLKVVTLDKGGAAIDDDDEEVIRRKYANTELYDEGEVFTFREKEKEKKSSIELKSRHLKQSDTDLSDGNEISHIIRENEKENGWIDFDKIQVSTITMPANKHGQSSFPTISQTQLLNQENPPSTNRGFLLNGEIPDVTIDNDPIVKKAKILPVVHGEKSSPAQEGFSDARLAKAVKLDFGDKNSRMTHVSSSVIQQKISKVFHEAVKTKYYPKSYRIFLTMWYLLLTVVLVNQFRINLVGESEMKDFLTRKNILMDSNGRSSVLPVLHMHIRSLWMIAQNISAYNLDMPSSIVIDFTFEDVDELRTENHELLETASKINDESREILFQKDIRVFEPNSNLFLNVTNFQAVDRIVEKGYQSLNIAYNNLEEAVPGFETILKNDLDDLLVKSDSISDVILKYTTDSNQSTIQDRTINLVLTVCGIIVMIIFFVVLVHKQYKKDINNLQAFLRINKHGVKVVMNRVLNFKKIVQGGDNFDEIPEGDIIRDYLKEFSKTRLQAKTEGTRDTQFLDSKGISRRFWFYLLQTLIILGVVTGVISVNQVISKNSLQENEKKLYQLHFLGDMKLDTTIVFASIMDVKVDPDTPAFVRNKPILIDISDQVFHFTKMISKVSDELQDSNSQYSPLVEEVLFQNLCAYVDDVDALQYCNAMQAGRTAGLLETLNEMDLFFKNIMEDNTTIDIAQAFNSFVIKDFVLRSALDTILDSLNTKFDTAIEAGADMIITLNISITISLILICIGVHFFVLRKVGESDNNFKRMLNTFPATLVLSNFMLKSFLLRTSRGTLDAIKDEI